MKILKIEASIFQGGVSASGLASKQSIHAVPSWTSQENSQTSADVKYTDFSMICIPAKEHSMMDKKPGGEDIACDEESGGTSRETNSQ